MLVTKKKYNRDTQDLKFIINDLRRTNDRLVAELYKAKNADKIKAVKKITKTAPTKRVVKKETK